MENEELRFRDLHSQFSILNSRLCLPSAAASATEVIHYLFAPVAGVAEYQEEKDDKPKYGIISLKTASPKKSHMFSTPSLYLVFQ